MARIAQIEGNVVATLEIGSNGTATNLIFDSGHPLLLEAAKSAMDQWVFPADTQNRQVKVTLDFKLNCASQ
jgi:outer membrane biosynthesis protein TonB